MHDKLLSKFPYVTYSFQASREQKTVEKATKDPTIHVQRSETNNKSKNDPNETSNIVLSNIRR